MLNYSTQIIENKLTEGQQMNISWKKEKAIPYFGYLSFQ